MPGYGKGGRRVANTNKPNDRRIGTELTADIRWRVNRHLLLGSHVAA